MDELCLKISNSVDELALLLDQLYKFPSRQREQYYERIQSCKNKLVGLKSNLRQTNLIHSQKTYQQIFLTINLLKNQIQAKINVRPKHRPSIHKINNHRLNSSVTLNEQSMNALQVIVNKQEHILSLKGKLQNVQHELKIAKTKQLGLNEEMTNIKTEISSLKIVNEDYKNVITQQKIENNRLRQSLRKLEDQLRNLRLNDRSNVDLCQQATLDLRKHKSRIIELQQHSRECQKQLQTQLMKMRSLQDINNRNHKQNLYKIQGFQLREKDLVRKISQMEKHISFQTVSKLQFSQLQQQKRRLIQDVKMLQIQLKEVSKLLTENSVKFQNDKNLIDLLTQENQQLRLLKDKNSQNLYDKQIALQKAGKTIQNLELTLQNSKQLLFQNEQNLKVNQRVISELQQHNKSLIKRIQNQQNSLADYQRQINMMQNKINNNNSQNIRIQKQIKQTVDYNKELRMELQRMNEKYQINEQEKQRLMQGIMGIKNSQREYQLNMKRLEESDEMRILQVKKGYESKINEIVKQKQKIQHEKENLKCLYIKAKIQTLHNIKEFIL